MCSDCGKHVPAREMFAFNFHPSHRKISFTTIQDWRYNICRFERLWEWQTTAQLQRWNAPTKDSCICTHTHTWKHFQQCIWRSSGGARLTHFHLSFDAYNTKNWKIYELTAATRQPQRLGGDGFLVYECVVVVFFSFFRNIVSYEVSSICEIIRIHGMTCWMDVPRDEYSSLKCGHFKGQPHGDGDERLEGIHKFTIGRCIWGWECSHACRIVSCTERYNQQGKNMSQKSRPNRIKRTRFT